MAFDLRRVKVVGKLIVQLVFKIANLFGPDPPTFRTDGQTDDMQSQHRAKVHRAVETAKTTYRPSSQVTSNGHNSARRHPIDFVFGSRVRFLSTSHSP